MALVEVIAANLNNSVKNSNNNKQPLKKVCAYARVSTDSEEQKTSYESQITYYTKLIKKNPNWEFAGIYADEGISGTQIKKRPEFKRMIADAKNGKIDIIMTKAISRFARNVVDTLNTVRELRECNVDVYFEKENIHTLDLSSEMFLSLYSTFAQAESESTSQNVKMGLVAKMKDGKPVGYYGCYGLHWNKKEKKYEIRENEAAVVRKIFTLYLHGEGTSRIAKILTKEGIKTATGKNVWQQATIVRIITNEKYVGDLRSQKSYVTDPMTHKKVKNYGEKEQYYVKDHHVALIDRETWNKAQKIYTARSLKVKPDGHSHSDKYSLRYPFSSKLYCACCGSNLVRRKTKKKNGKGEYIYWACSKKVANHSCNVKSIREDFLEKMFLQLYNKMVKTYNIYDTKLYNVIKETINSNNYEIEINKLKAEEEMYKNKLSGLLDLKIENYIDKEVYISKQSEIKSKLNDISEKILAYQEKANNSKSLDEKLTKIEKVLKANRKYKKFNEELFNILVDCVIVGKENEDTNETPTTVRFVLNTGEEVREELDLRYKSLMENNEQNRSLSNDNKYLLSFDNDRRLWICDGWKPRTSARKMLNL